MSRIIWLAALVSPLSPGVVSLATAGDYHPCQGLGEPFSPHKPRPGDSVNNGYGGTVTAVTKDSITIQWGNSSDEKPKTFAASEALAAGKPGVEPRWLPGARYAYRVEPTSGYRLADVKVGDCLIIFYARVDGIDICDHIRINRRPDGDVPPLPKEAEDLRNPREVWKVTHPGKPLPPDRFTQKYIPYHEWINAYWAKIAPMPREVKVGPATTP